jgi:hypothetical protein
MFKNNQSNACFAAGCMILLISSPLARIVVNHLYQGTNLTTEYIPILTGFIHSFMLIGVLTFSIGLVILAKNKL